MGVTLRHEEGNVYRVDFSGRLAKRDFEAVQQSVAEEIRKSGKVRLLIGLDGFVGWESGANWSDLNFYIQYGNKVKKIAIVGDEGWRDEVLMFAAADLRRGPVRFFSRERNREARTWITK